MSSLFLGDGRMVILDSEDSVGDDISEEKFSCSSRRMHFPCMAIVCYRIDRHCLDT
jgi:hypothetical protein